MVIVYVAFYTCFENPEAKFNWCHPIDSTILKLTDFWAGPFTHCHIAHHVHRKKGEKEDPENVLCTKITFHLNQVTHAVFKENKIHTCYMQLNLDETEYSMMLRILERIKAHKTFFSYKNYFGLGNGEACSEKKEGWLCCSLVGYLLQRIGVINNSISVKDLNVTTLYLAMRENVIKCKQVEFHPFKRNQDGTLLKIRTCDYVYTKFMGINVENIPIYRDSSAKVSPV